MNQMDLYLFGFNQEEFPQNKRNISVHQSNDPEMNKVPMITYIKVCFWSVTNVIKLTSDLMCSLQI